MGGTIYEREARRDKVVIEFPTTEKKIHLTNCAHNLTRSQTLTVISKILKRSDYGEGIIEEILLLNKRHKNKIKTNKELSYARNE